MAIYYSAFPNRPPYDFRFDGPLLRLGARLEANGTELRIRRRKGNKETLLDELDAPLSEAELQAHLRGYSAEAFRTAYSLDHQRLRAGGKAMLEATDNVGHALFAAGSGLIGVQDALAKLEAEADLIWGARRLEQTQLLRKQRPS